jgi:hypothetical protein
MKKKEPIPFDPVEMAAEVADAASMFPEVNLTPDVLVRMGLSADYVPAGRRMQIPYDQVALDADLDAAFTEVYGPGWATGNPVIPRKAKNPDDEFAKSEIEKLQGGKN